MFDENFDRSVTGTRKWNPQLLHEKLPESKDIIAMDLADIDFPCAPTIQEALIKRAQMPDYSYTFVPDEFYDAVIEWNRDYFNLELEKDWIRLTFGTISALHNIVQALSAPGDAVMIHTPAYAPFAEAVEHNGRKLVCNRLVMKGNRYQIDFEQLEQQMIQHHVKLFILCNPQNPSGRVWTKEELIRVANLCQLHQVYLISDEIHRDIVFEGVTFTSLWAAAPEVMNQSVLCISPNKGFNLGGLKTSYIVVPNSEIRSKIYQRLSANYVTSPHVFAVPAIVAAYRHEHTWLKDMVAYVRENHLLVERFIAENMPLFQVIPAESSFLVWINVEKVVQDETAVKAFFAEAGLTVVLGSYFVDNADGYVRFNIGMQRAKVCEALERMRMVYQRIMRSKI